MHVPKIKQGQSGYAAQAAPRGGSRGCKQDVDTRADNVSGQGLPGFGSQRQSVQEMLASLTEASMAGPAADQQASLSAFLGSALGTGFSPLILDGWGRGTVQQAATAAAAPSHTAPVKSEGPVPGAAERERFSAQVEQLMQEAEAKGANLLGNATPLAMLSGRNSFPWASGG